MIRALGWALVVLSIAACSSDALDDASGDSLSIRIDGEQAVVEGTIDGETPERFTDFFADHPSVEVFSLSDIDGSVDDAANLEAGRLIRSQAVTTRIDSEGLVASGGTDLFLAGTRRSVEPGACIGVHSWSDDSGTEGADLPDDHPDHAPYLDYYREMGIDEAFYWFTLDAAPAEGMHWMTRAEMREFGVATEMVGEDLGAECGLEGEG